MSFTAAIELATLIAYAVVIAGGRAKRETGWKILAFLLMVVGILQCACMSLVVCFAFSLSLSPCHFLPWASAR